MTETAVVETPVVETPKVEESTLLGKTGTADEIAKLASDAEAAKAEALKNETPEQKAARLANESKAVPEKYEVKAPEGMTIDQGMLDKLTPVFKKHGLTQEAVQELADAYAPAIKAQVEASKNEAQTAFKEITDGWKAETLKMLGAEPHKELAYAAKALDKFGEPELRRDLDETGFGNHPRLTKMLIQVGKLISTDSVPDAKTKAETNDDGLMSIYKE